MFSDYGIYVDNAPNLDYNTKNTYPFTVKCNDGYKDSNTGIFYVYIKKNQAPVVHNLQGNSILSMISVHILFVVCFVYFVYFNPFSTAFWICIGG